MRTWKTAKGTELPILDLRGKDYLQVAHRLLWFREECPKHSLETEFISVTETSAFAKATVRDEQGRVLSTAHKFEDKAGFADFREKAETGAIGRALALIGYGTQFAADELDEGDRLADSPVASTRGVFPEHAPPGDGHVRAGVAPYRIPFGKYQKRGLEEIDVNDLRSYVSYLEKKAQADNKPITGVVAEFVERATNHIVALEQHR